MILWLAGYKFHLVLKADLGIEQFEVVASSQRGCADVRHDKRAATGQRTGDFGGIVRQMEQAGIISALNSRSLQHWHYLDQFRVEITRILIKEARLVSSASRGVGQDAIPRVKVIHFSIPSGGTVAKHLILSGRNAALFMCGYIGTKFFVARIYAAPNTRDFQVRVRSHHPVWL